MKNLKAFVLGGLLASVVAFAGTANLAQIVTNVIQRAHVNDIRTALYQDLVPRNSSGTTTSLGGSIGTSTYQWLKARIASGYWQAGDIKAHHTYNGLVAVGEGWMLCDGRTISSTTYDTEHGSGHWTTYVGTSTLNGLKLPDLTNDRYLAGAATTTQTGSGAITTVGNASNQANLQHTHTVTVSKNNWYHGITGADDQVQSGNLVGFSNVTKGTAKSFMSILVGSSTAINAILGAGTVGPLENADGTQPRDPVTYNGGTGTTSNGGSTTQNIQPESIEVVYYMRVID